MTTPPAVKRKKYADDAVGRFVESHLHLLDMERQAEIDSIKELQSSSNDEELQRRGLCILRLQISDTWTTLGGRVTVALESTKNTELPISALSPGDIVSIRPSKHAAQKEGGSRTKDGSSQRTVEGANRGSVYRITATAICISLEEEFDEANLQGALRVDKLVNDVTYRRQRAALYELSECTPEHPTFLLRQLMFDLHDPVPALPVSFQAFNPSLDQSQIAAVSRGLGSTVALIQGPPGTGKSTTVVELIHQCVKRGEKVLVAAPSNIAVDTLVERTAQLGTVRVVRFGNPQRVISTVLEHTLDSLVEDQFRGVGLDIKKELGSMYR